MIKAVSPVISFRGNKSNIVPKTYIEAFEEKVLKGINTDRAKQILRDEFNKMESTSQKRFLTRLFSELQSNERFLRRRDEDVFQLASKLYKVSQDAVKSITAKLAAPAEERNLLEIYKLRLQE